MALTRRWVQYVAATKLLGAVPPSELERWVWAAPASERPARLASAVATYKLGGADAVATLTGAGGAVRRAADDPKLALRAERLRARFGSRATNWTNLAFRQAVAAATQELAPSAMAEVLTRLEHAVAAEEDGGLDVATFIDAAERELRGVRGARVAFLTTRLTNAWWDSSPRVGPIPSLAWMEAELEAALARQAPADPLAWLDAVEGALVLGGYEGAFAIVQGSAPW